MSGIQGYLHTHTSMTILFTNGDAYRYDLSEHMSRDQLKQMVKLAKAGSGLNAYLNSQGQLRKRGYLETGLRKSSFTPYGA